METLKQYRCTLCNEAQGISYENNTCPLCGERGILDVEFDYDIVRESLEKAPLSSLKERSMFRYQAFLSVDISTHKEVLNVGWTPLYHAHRLGAYLGLKNLTIKDEGVNPSGSLKDRASAIAVLDARAKGIDTIACSSTGNAASSLAANGARANVRTVIFVPKRVPKGKLVQLMMYGAHVIRVDGDYKAAYNLSKDAIERYGWYNRNAAINPHLVEGKKTVMLEIAEQLNFVMPDWVVVSIGDGCTVAGVYKALLDLTSVGLIKTMPKILGVQAEGCAPFHHAFMTNQPLEETDELTLADSIAVGIPRNPVKGLRAIERTFGTTITVDDDHILKAAKQLASYEGVFAEPAASASVAGLEKALRNGIIHKDDHVTLIATGNGLKDPDNARKASGDPVEITDDAKALHEYLKDKGVV